MAATGFTPIQLYRTTTASAQPSAGNLADGELAINLTDKKLYAKDASNNVFVLADASSGGTTATNLAGGAAGSVPYQTGANATTFLGIGTAAQVLQVNSGATAPEWVNTSGTGDVARTTSPSFTTPSLGAATALSINSLTLTTSTGTFTLANGKTLTVNNSLTLSGTDATTMTFPSTSATIARTDAAQSFTGTQTFLSNPVLDAGTANGVLYLNGSKVVTSGSALTFDGSTFSNVQGSGTAALSFNQLSFSRNGANYLTATLSSLNYGASQHIFGNNDLSSEWMRLTSTGLGIGTDNPGAKLEIAQSADTTDGPKLRIANNGNTLSNGQLIGGIDFFDGDDSGEGVGAYIYSYTTDSIGRSVGQDLRFATGATETMRLDSSGNLGLGVTPSAWATYTALQTGWSALAGYAAADTALFSNAYFDGGYKYIGNGFASQYRQINSAHQWFTAASGTAGDPISFTQAMTLDASGNLLVGGTSALGSAASRGNITVNGATDAILSFGNAASLAGYILQDSGGMTLFSSGATYQRFYTNNTERARITSGGNFKIGGSADRATTEGDKQLVLFDGTAPVGTLANGVSFYSASGEANVMDAAGNATLLSPHDAETNEWIFRSKHTPTGKVLKIDVERLLKFVNDHFGLDAVHEFIEA